MKKSWGSSYNMLKGPGCIFFILFLSSCNGPAKKNNSTNNLADSLKTVQKKTGSSFSDTIRINFPSAVFYNPDSLQLEKIKEITPKNDYESDVHNCFYLMRNARAVLKKNWPQIHIVETSVNRYLLFIKTNKTRTCIDLNTRGDMCGIFLFDGTKDPELADMMNIDTAFGFYFKK